jgi:hypothetical protein
VGAVTDSIEGKTIESIQDLYLKVLNKRKGSIENIKDKLCAEFKFKTCHKLLMMLKVIRIKFSALYVGENINMENKFVHYLVIQNIIFMLIASNNG